jgi:hypothetical protein
MSNGLFSAIGATYKALVARLTRKGVHVGGTGAYPRVEVHSVIENPPMDKGGSIKSLTCTVECISEDRLASVLQMNADNLDLLLKDSLQIDQPWHIIGIDAGVAQQLTETSDTNAIIYRLIQDLTIYVERK